MYYTYYNIFSSYQITYPLFSPEEKSLKEEMLPSFLIGININKYTNYT